MIILGKRKVKQLVESFNWVNIEGLKGEGKTLFSLDVARLYLEQGFYLLTNAQTIWSDRYEDIQPLPNGEYGIIMISDEGGWYTRTLETISKIFVESNKMLIYWLCPSVMLPHEELLQCIFYPVFKIGRLVVWAYENHAFGHEKKAGSSRPWSFLCVQWTDDILRAVYATSAPSSRPTSLLSFFDFITAQFAARHGVEEYGLSDLAQPDSIKRTSSTSSAYTVLRSLNGSGSGTSTRRRKG